MKKYFISLFIDGEDYEQILFSYEDLESYDSKIVIPIGVQVIGTKGPDIAEIIPTTIWNKATFRYKRDLRGLNDLAFIKDFFLEKSLEFESDEDALLYLEVNDEVYNY